MEDLLQNASRKYGVDQLREYQAQVIRSYLAGRDVFFSAPTGSGKTLVLEMAPFAFNLNKRQSLRGSAIVCVVSPLLQLMRSQCSDMKKKGINAVCLSDICENDVSELDNGNFSIILGSPEAWLGKWRDLLSTDVYRDRVSALFVDEAHCINTWGVDKMKEKAFRKMYGQIGELRSVIPVPCITMTATSSKETEILIKRLLDMKDCVDVVVPPNKSNIKYSIFDQGEKENVTKSFGWLVDELESKGRLTDKVIIFTKSYKDCHLIYEFFSQALCENAYSPYNRCGQNNDMNRLFDMFHSNVEQEQKHSTVESFNSPDGNIRVLIATSALGMGVDIKCVYECYHFGPPCDFDSYLQESGRVGRCVDRVSHAVLITYKKSTQGKVSPEMKGYVKNHTQCRRKLIYSKYMTNIPANEVLHTCCDICAEICQCDSCDECVSQLHLHYKAAEIIDEEIHPCKRKLPQDLKTEFQFELLEYRKRLCSKCGDSCMFTGYDIATGFSLTLINKLVNNVDILNDKKFLTNFPFFDSSHVDAVWEILQELLESYDIQEDSENIIECTASDFAVALMEEHNYTDDDDDDDDEDDDVMTVRKRPVVLCYSDSDSD